MTFKRDEMEKQELSFLPLDSIEAKVASLVKLSIMYLTGSKTNHEKQTNTILWNNKFSNDV